MDFMISLFGSEQTGRPKLRRRISANKTAVTSMTPSMISAVPKKIKQLPPEDDEGNIEYKLKLVEPSPSRFQHLVTQMKWRLREGQGEAIYEIGVEDDGVCAGLTDREMEASLSTLKRMALELGAFVTILREREVGDVSLRRRVAEVLVRKVPDNQQFIDLRIAVLGCADAGKSTLLGVLTQGEMDNGRGKSRLNLFRHLHEVQSGRTSSISMDILGFDSEGKTLNHRDHTVEEICDQSTKLITFIDLAGHQKYMKTTIFGLTGYKPHFVALVVAANMGIVGTTKDHLAWAIALEVPFFVVVTKIDKSNSSKVEKTLSVLENILKQPSYLRICLRVRTEDDALTLAASFCSLKIVPVFTVSSVTGENLDLLEKFFNVLPSYSQRDREELLQEEPEFQIDEIFNVSGVGLVACGLLAKGVVREGDELRVGPDLDGSFKTVFVESLQRNRNPCRLVQAGQSAAVALGDFGEFSLRKGMVLLGPIMDVFPTAVTVFEAEIYVIFHPFRYMAENFQVTVHIGNVCQTAVMVKIETRTGSLTVGESAKVKFKFLRQPEYITIGSRLLFREGKTKGIGQVVTVGDADDNSTDSSSDLKM